MTRKEDTDFQSVEQVTASPEQVLAALRDNEAISRWWGLTSGVATEGGAFQVGFGGGRQIDMTVVASDTAHVVWAVDAAPHTPEWAGTTIVFEIAPLGEGSEVRFRHRGLTPKFECYEMCDAGWTHFLASLVSYLETGQGQPYVGD